ncbi:MAG TPA: hypothetical protein VMA34_21970 [Terracidiphilus sp.]|nr:hypothetical protein [Terracidiphilus sp.]
MRRTLFLSASALIAFLTLAAAPLTLSAHPDNNRCRKCKVPPPASRITVTVLRNDDGKPIRNAAVVFHAIEGDKDKGGLELKSNEDGVAVMDVIPIGDTVLLQVIANGYQTYGGEYKVSKPQMSMHIRLKRPGQQYSIYDNREDADSGASSGNQSQDGSQGSSNGGSSGAQKH